VVEQLTLTSVRVSWHGLLEQGDCADNILVKHYRGIDSNNYEISDPLVTSVTSYIVHDLTPNQEYTYQVIAREEKGIFGVDYNRGDKTVFTTSRQNRERGLEVKPDDPLVVHNSDVDGGRQGQGVVPVYSESQRTKTLVGGMQVELLMVIIVGALVVCIVTVGIVYNFAKRKGPEKDLELNSSMCGNDDDDDGEDGDEEDEDEEEDEFEDDCKETKKYDMMTELNKREPGEHKLMRPMSVA